MLYMDGWGTQKVGLVLGIKGLLMACYEGLIGNTNWTY